MHGKDCEKNSELTVISHFLLRHWWSKYFWPIWKKLIFWALNIKDPYRLKEFYCFAQYSQFLGWHTESKKSNNCFKSFETIFKRNIQNKFSGNFRLWSFPCGQLNLKFASWVSFYKEKRWITNWCSKFFWKKNSLVFRKNRISPHVLDFSKQKGFQCTKIRPSLSFWELFHKDKCVDRDV